MIAEQVNRVRKMSMFQRTIFVFLLGFFIGLFFCFIFQSSLKDLYKPYIKTVNYFSKSQNVDLLSMIRILWKHGRYFLLLWMVSVNVKMCHLYKNAFLIYTGVCQGFMAIFFVINEGGRGIWIYFCSEMPQAIFFVPLYLISFLYIEKKPTIKHPFIFGSVLLLAFLLACFLEGQYNYRLLSSQI